MIGDTTPWAWLSCPGCGGLAVMDRDQYFGRVSVWHDKADGGCGYHEIVDWSQADDPRVTLLDQDDHSCEGC